MESLRFDRIAIQFADRLVSRRQALTTGGAGLAAGALAAAGITSAVAAQDATPDATDTQPPYTKVPFLFVQSFQSGSVEPIDGVEGRYTLTLEQGHGQTIYFSDRPDRVVGANPTPEFLEGLGFLPDNPPNAALVIETAVGETDVAVIELFNPLYDPVTRGVIYEVEVLGNWQASLEMGFTEAPTDLASLAPNFGSAQLFIDDCPNLDIWCLGTDQDYLISADADMCWNYSRCQPCEPYGHTYPDYCAGANYWREKCNQRFNRCNRSGGCTPYWDWAILPYGCAS
jgi:hypothetical protein